MNEREPASLEHVNAPPAKCARHTNIPKQHGNGVAAGTEVRLKGMQIAVHVIVHAYA